MHVDAVLFTRSIYSSYTVGFSMTAVVRTEDGFCWHTGPEAETGRTGGVNVADLFPETGA